MKIIYTHTDEAPALATQSLLPIISTFTATAGVKVETRDISLAGRILAQFPELLTEAQRVPDALTELGELAKTPNANIIKLPNISASVPQLKAAIKELQEQGYKLPDYPDEPNSDAEKDARARYDRVKGSAVNPVLREGNSDRRAPASVKAYAKSHPHKVGAWSKDSKSHVSTMSDGDFRSTERSLTLPAETTVQIAHVAADGTVTVLKDELKLEAGEVLDAAVMRAKALNEFLAAQVADAKEKDVLFSVHLKATMMKVSDPIIFGHAVRAFFPGLEAPGWNPDDGLGALPEGTKLDYSNKPKLAMVNSDKGITNLHVPSDVIIDASMPAAIRSSGQMWNADDQQEDTKFVIPDHSYAPLYHETVEDAKANGAFDPATLGTTPNVGLMAQKAEEYGSHDKTFEIESAGQVRVVDPAGKTLLSHDVEAGDIWRACQAKDVPIRNWVQLAISRAKATGAPAVFWLDETRPHDAEILKKVHDELEKHDTSGLEILIKDVGEATRYTLARARAGKDTISVTGNVLRDYLTDLFPILELGTSAKMLSIVPLIAGGGLFETGAGGSAPKHVQQFQEEDHLRWDSLGEFLALAESLNFLAEKTNNKRARLLGKTLDQATGKLLENGKSPSRKVGELDNRGSHFYLALYWAQALAAQTEEPELAEQFKSLAETLSEQEQEITLELDLIQGTPVDIGGYYHPDAKLTANAMRPSEALNNALANFSRARNAV
ncbi:MAG: NADP-dependent isocitrate dehydrogenase [Solirubrobacterales bacterium]|nr:NADP-dependent isocitrate dehydrogenase [Solirubrobacterales bacterium]